MTIPKQNYIICFQHVLYQQGNVVVETSLFVREVQGSITGPVKLDTGSLTARHLCDVSSELCCPGADRGDGSRHSLHASA